MSQSFSNIQFDFNMNDSDKKRGKIYIILNTYKENLKPLTKK